MKPLDELLRFDVVDVFTDRPFAGNPLAVVHGAEGLSTEQLHAIAREFNLSETVFPLPPTTPEATYRARIFTPEKELPFAGHPSVGVAWVLARDGVIEAGDAVQECGAGLLPVTVDASGARITGGPPTIGPEFDAVVMAEAIGLSASDVDTSVRAGLASAGLEFPILPVRPDAVSRARVPLRGALPSEAQASGHVLVVAFDATTRSAHVRMFGPGSGVDEDPATGSASVALAVFLVDRGLLPADGHSGFTSYQGAEIHRPSRLDVEVTAEGGTAIRTSVGGRVVAVSSGQIAIPPA
ncbi:PhzF family phenazine biosynthesis protein [Pseudonocardia spinosispora]|uniref:PhzF family phenazine biosynthesis protein n=1 Tax=Pseudonocardia spinosispora TaxID=103441 RepID=UPI000407DC6F|nr:PhzF family phenazine biosynthesis protein [Pseudonocardia spinosispora]